MPRGVACSAFRVFKPVDWQTSAVEVMHGDAIVAEVFAGADGVRRLYVHDEAAKGGIDWNGLIEAAPRITALLDEVDAERRSNGS